MTPDTPAMDEKGVGCPFCGADETEVEFTNSTTWCYQRCKSCGATGPRVCAGHGGDSKDAWNLRASLKAVPEVEVVKLNWKYSIGPGEWQAYSILGAFRVSDSRWELERHARIACDSDDDAKASAQSYFEARIRSCLATPQPSPDADGDAA